MVCPEPICRAAEVRTLRAWTTQKRLKVEYCILPSTLEAWTSRPPVVVQPMERSTTCTPTVGDLMEAVALI